MQVGPSPNNAQNSNNQYLKKIYLDIGNWKLFWHWDLVIEICVKRYHHWLSLKIAFQALEDVPWMTNIG